MINNKKKTLELLLDFSNKFKKDLWLEGGSALGAVREGALLDWDHDIDIGLWYNDIINNMEILDYFNKFNYKLIFKKILYLLIILFN